MRIRALAAAVAAVSAVASAGIPKPDLAGGSLQIRATLPSTCSSFRAQGQVRIEVRNQGYASSLPTALALFEDLDGDGRLSAGDARHASFPVPALAPCERQNLGFNYDQTLAFRGSPLKVALDPANLVLELDEDNNTVADELSCRVQQPLDFSLQQRWWWQPASCAGSRPRVVSSPPLVAQTSDDNSDGRVDERDDPDLVFLESAPDPDGALLRVLDARTGTERATLQPSIGGLATLYGIPAVGDLDGDGVPELIVKGQGSDFVMRVAALHVDGSFLWVSQVPASETEAITLGDLDADGSLEVVAGRSVLLGDGSLVWSNPFPPVRGDNRAELADLDGDGNLEVLAGGAAFRLDGSVLWQHRDPLAPDFVPPEFPFGGSGALVRAPLGATPNIYFAARSDRLDSRDNLYLLDGVTGTVLLGPVQLPFGGVAAMVAVGDLDGDRISDAAIAVNGGGVVAISSNFAELWSLPLPGWSAGDLGLFDFDGDGVQEVLVRHDFAFEILAGQSGLALATDATLHPTVGEFPIVADADRDGHAEVFVPVADASDPPAYCGLIAYANPSWIGARNAWPDVDYHISDSDDRGCTPQQMALSWCDHDTWRAQRPVFAHRPNATLSLLAFDVAGCPDVALSARVGASSMATLPAGVTVTFYDGNPDFGGVPIASATTTRDLPPGSFEDVAASFVSTGPVVALHARLATAGAQCSSNDDDCGPVAVPDCGQICSASASARDVAYCAGGAATLDASASLISGCPVPPEYSFWRGAIQLRGWDPAPTWSWSFAIAGLYRVEMRCPTNSACNSSAEGTLTTLPDVVPPDQGNVLHAVRAVSDVMLDFRAAAAPECRITRDVSVAQLGMTALLPDPVGRGFVDAGAVPAAPRLFFYRLRGLSPCSHTPGP